MNDTVAVAVITAAATGLTGLIGSWFAHMAGKRQAQTSIVAAQTAASVEMTRIEAENQRLRDEHLENARRERQAMYATLLAHVNALDLMGGGYVPVSEGDLNDWVSKYLSLRSELQIIAPDTVVEAEYTAFKAIVDEFVRHTPVESELDGPAQFKEKVVSIYQTHRPAIVTAIAGLINATRKDMAAGTAAADTGGAGSLP